MNLPFGLIARKESVQKRREDEQELSRLEDMLVEYQDVLENYRRCIREYYSRLENRSRESQEDVIASVQAALDLACIKEQSEKTNGKVEELNTQMELINNHLMDIKAGYAQKSAEKLDLLSLSLEELSVTVDRLAKRVKRGRAFNAFMLVLNILGIGMLAFLMLYLLEIIPF